ncbi:uncharacterized protein RMCFA_3899 [Mycolicibacterium fortuitum subsp. acetamidolyticum]|uniref:Integrase n=1 Tax=Mycolicibacterium fortuitum subsp. acetamidolyticum TaxID=144550 RepID=A0A100WT22_MYCFO|nr:hypothetical protein [Mycolicibacterium fortuitum]MCV7143477.1 hypothetical protein [Mycolicibacterium fortuitum]GAT03787.1 uncharacterized protein RMCFA_3899 [Mycolicibacterium fortuitum subsp. acetamidolyticum]
MTSGITSEADTANGGDLEPIDWDSVQAGPVVTNPLRLKYPDLPMSMFSDDSWSLRPMGVTPGSLQNLHWIPGPRDQKTPIPEVLIPAFKRVFWLFINRRAPAAFLGVSNTREWPAPSTIATRFHALRHFGAFLGEHEITRFCEIDAELLDSYATKLIAGETRKSITATGTHLGYVAAISYLHNYLPTADHMIQPTWSNKNLDHRRSRGADNSKEIIHPDTFAPLLWWSQQMLKCAPDVLAAVRWLNTAGSRPQPKQGSKESLDAVGAIVSSYGGVLPAGGDGYAAGVYLAAHSGGRCNGKDFRQWQKVRGGTYSTDSSLSQPIPVAVTCAIEGRPWLPFIDFRDVGKLHRAVLAAGAVLICACSGMRGDECAKLPRGALRIVPRPDGATSYRIDGRIYKGVSDKNRRQDPNGKEWVWATIKPGADAAATLDRLAEASESDLLIHFPHSRRHPDPRNPASACTDLVKPEVTTANLTRWISEFIEFANELCTSLGLHEAHRIAPDPAGNVTLDRFRRSVAWHIVNQPEGLLAAGVQFGHMKSTTTDGYASTITSGMAATMDQERTRALYTTLQNHANSAKTGMRASGPAAKRLGNALNRFTAAQFPGTYADMTRKDERRLRNDPDMVVRENPGHTCLCLADPMKPETMACSQENDGEPNRNDCKTYCGNRVYTDATVAADIAEAVQLRTKLDNVNPILASRIRGRIEHLEAHIAEHDSTALPLRQIMTLEEAKAESALAEKSKRRDT